MDSFILIVLNMPAVATCYFVIRVHPGREDNILLLLSLSFSPCFSLCSCLLWFFYDITDMTLICQRTSRVNFFNLFLRHLFIYFFVGISVCTSNRRRKTSCCLTKSWATTLDWQRRWHTMTIWKQCRPSNISHILTTILRFLK